MLAMASPGNNLSDSFGHRFSSMKQEDDEVEDIMHPNF